MSGNSEEIRDDYADDPRKLWESLSKEERDNLRPIDSPMFELMLEEPAIAQHVLETITQYEDLVVASVEINKHLKLADNTVRLAVLATDTKGRKYNLEVPKGETNDLLRRLLVVGTLHHLAIEADLVSDGTKIEDLPERYVIFLAEQDLFGRGAPMYAIVSDVNGKPALPGTPDDTGRRTLIVNGQWR